MPVVAVQCAGVVQCLHLSVKIGDEQMKALETQGILTRHGFHGEWNYTLNPTADDTPDSNDLK